jgi:hypothetical protein
VPLSARDLGGPAARADRKEAAHIPVPGGVRRSGSGSRALGAPANDSVIPVKDHATLSDELVFNGTGRLRRPRGGAVTVKVIR